MVLHDECTEKARNVWGCHIAVARAHVRQLSSLANMLACSFLTGHTGISCSFSIYEALTRCQALGDSFLEQSHLIMNIQFANTEAVYLQPNLVLRAGTHQGNSLGMGFLNHRSENSTTVFLGRFPSVVYIYIKDKNPIFIGFIVC